MEIPKLSKNYASEVMTDSSGAYDTYNVGFRTVLCKYYTTHIRLNETV